MRQMLEAECEAIRSAQQAAAAAAAGGTGGEAGGGGKKRARVPHPGGGESGILSGLLKHRAGLQVDWVLTGVNQGEWPALGLDPVGGSGRAGSGVPAQLPAAMPNLENPPAQPCVLQWRPHVTPPHHRSPACPNRRTRLPAGRGMQTSLGASA